ncbi:MAG: acetate--CoA ligase family protein [Thaumarchaeota archaeon]|nr:acetate--CoA ligase family protein [Candidatus Calditenuaceae archaeon]MDW8186683.1 acetate--CoA ligase family protein [Nitrososphaerota archaeon]
MSMQSFFNPKSVAIIGASRDPNRPGNTILKNLKSMGYRGRVFPVNPNLTEIDGLQCYPDVLSIDEDVENVVILVSADRAVRVAEEIAERRKRRNDVKAVICISGGFSELNTSEGRERERRLVETLKGSGVRLMGPNCVGVIDCYSRFTTNFDLGDYPTGGISLVSQSGALATAFLFWARPFNRIGLSKLVSIGNMADVDMVECIEYLGNDPTTDVIGVYLEGYRDPRKLFETMRNVSSEKPIVLLKAGRSEIGSSAALSHTASLTGLDALYDAASKQCGVIRVKDVLEWYETLHAIGKQPIPQGNRVAVLTHIGGPGTLTVDRIGIGRVLRMAAISDRGKSAIRSMVAPTATVCSPDGYIDLTASHTEELHYKVLKVLFEEEGVDSVIQVVGHSMFLSQTLMADRISTAFEEVGRANRKTFLNVVAFDESLPEFKLGLENRGLPEFPTPEIAVTVLEYMYWYANKRKRLASAPRLTPLPPARSEPPVLGREVLLESEAYPILKRYGISVADYRIETNYDELEDAAEEIGFPVVLKAQHQRLIHKTDAGAVALNISDASELRERFHEVTENVIRHIGEPPSSYLVQKMIKPGAEVIVGAVHDDSFGPVISFGSGGVLVELLKDVSSRLIPLSEDEAAEMIQETFASRLLSGFRGEEPKDINALVELLLKVSEMMLKEGWIKELDLNPVKPLRKGYAVVDARIVLR